MKEKKEIYEYSEEEQKAIDEMKKRIKHEDELNKYLTDIRNKEPFIKSRYS